MNNGNCLGVVSFTKHKQLNLDSISSGDTHNFNFNISKKNTFFSRPHNLYFTVFRPACLLISNSYKVNMTLD